ncbi:unnamed protein product, partial [Amoebophrya sp. A25]|eukprot:GSA25T00015001001.1
MTKGCRKHEVGSNLDGTGYLDYMFGYCTSPIGMGTVMLRHLREVPFFKERANHETELSNAFCTPDEYKNSLNTAFDTNRSWFGLKAEGPRLKQLQVHQPKIGSHLPPKLAHQRLYNELRGHAEHSPVEQRDLDDFK